MSPFAALMRGQIASARAGLVSGIKASGTPSVSVGRRFTLSEGSVVDIGQVRASTGHDLRQVQTQLTSLLAQNGINAGAGVQLQVDAAGQMHVVGPAGQQDAIAALLSANPQFQNLLSSVAQNSRILHAADSVQGSGDSAQNAFNAAVTGLSKPATTFTLLVAPQGTTVSFAPLSMG